VKNTNPLAPILTLINQRPQRERMMILVTSLTCLLMAGMQGIEVFGKKIKQLNTIVEEKSDAINQLNGELSRLQIEYSVDPNSHLKQQQTQLQTDLDKTEKELESMMYSLVEPKKMVKVIRDLFVNQTSLKLIQLKNLSPQRLTTEVVLPSSTAVESIKPTEKVDIDQKIAPDLYRHALVITFEGDFFSVVNYLKTLEKLKWRFYWKSIHYQVSEYPNAIIMLELHTFSREKGVLGV
jgi:MSHA biogenesis protein MshJ